MPAVHRCALVASTRAPCAASSRPKYTTGSSITALYAAATDTLTPCPSHARPSATGRDEHSGLIECAAVSFSGSCGELEQARPSCGLLQRRTTEAADHNGASAGPVRGPGASMRVGGSIHWSLGRRSASSLQCRSLCTAAHGVSVSGVGEACRHPHFLHAALHLWAQNARLAVYSSVFVASGPAPSLLSAFVRSHRDSGVAAAAPESCFCTSVFRLLCGPRQS